MACGQAVPGRNGSAAGDVLASFLRQPGTLLQPSLIVRVTSDGRTWAVETVVDKPPMRFRLERALLRRVETFHCSVMRPFDAFFLVSDNLYLSEGTEQAFAEHLRHVAFYRCDQRPGNLASMASRIIPDYSLLERAYAAEFAAVLAASKAIPFHERRGIIAWRGRISGPGYPDITTCDSFPRYRLLRLAHARPDVVDARVTDDSNLHGTPARAALRKEIERLVGPAQEPWPPESFVRYKYLIALDGAVAAWKRVPTILASGSVLLLQADWRQDFYSELRPWENYVPVSRDLSDLLDRHAWLEAHEGLALEIGRNGQHLARTWLTPAVIERRFTAALAQSMLPITAGDA
jgi:hypothetical protein